LVTHTHARARAHTHVRSLLQGNFFVDEKVLRAVGQTNFDHYAYVPGTKEFWPDFFIEEQDGMCAPHVHPRAEPQALSNADDLVACR
jgi:hypothetical protein